MNVYSGVMSDGTASSAAYTCVSPSHSVESLDATRPASGFAHICRVISLSMSFPTRREIRNTILVLVLPRFMRGRTSCEPSDLLFSPISNISEANHNPQCRVSDNT